MKTWQKIAITIVATLATLSVIAILVIISALPSPAWIGARLRARDRQAIEQNSESAATNAGPPSATAANGAPVTITGGGAVSIATATGAPTATNATATLTKEQHDRLVAEKFVERYLSDERMTSEVCENLGSATPPFQGADQFSKQMESSLLGQAKLSASAEAVMMPIEYTLKNDSVRDLIRAAENAADRGDTGFVQKAQFYAMAARATASILSSREELESVSGHAYRLYAISRAAALKPEILLDPDTGDLCRGIQRSAIDGVERDENFDRERLDRLLSRHGISPEKIGYDPALSTRIQVLTGDSGLQVRMPWLETALKAQR